MFLHDNLYLRRAKKQLPEDLNPRARTVCRKLTSAMTVSRLYKLTGGSYYRFVVEAYALAEKGLLEVLDQGKATPKSTRELPLSNLLMEQAA